MSGKVKYYIYISDTKLDMLYPQIPRSLFRKFTPEFSFNLKLPVSEMGAAIKGNQIEDIRYTKLKETVKYIEENCGIGTIDQPLAYFRGTLPMQWGLLGASNVVYYGGSTASTTVGLGGSGQHVIGGMNYSPIQPIPTISKNPRGIPTDPNDSGSGIPAIFKAFESVLFYEARARERALLQQIHSTAPIQDANHALDAVKLIERCLRGPYQNLEFLARKLIVGESRVGEAYGYFRQVILGTPIYIALAD